VNFVDLMGLGKTLIIGFNWMDYLSRSWLVGDKMDKYYSSIGMATEQVADSFNQNNWIYYDKRITIETKLYNSSIAWSITYWLVDYIKEWKFDKIIILWHSEWADSAVELANRLWENDIKVNKLITVDLFAANNSTVLNDNILEAENYYQTNWTFIKWATTLTGSDGNSTTNISNTNYNSDIPYYMRDLIKYDTELYYHRTLDNHLSKEWILQNSMINTILYNK